MNQATQETPMAGPITLKSTNQDRLARLAEELDRSDDELANEAIEQYLDYHEWAIAEIKRGVADADAGRTVPHSAVRAWIGSLSTDDELPMPQSSRV